MSPLTGIPFQLNIHQNACIQKYTELYGVNIACQDNMAATKHVDLSLSDKVKSVNELKAPSATQVQVAKQFGVVAVFQLLTLVVVSCNVSNNLSCSSGFVQRTR